MWKVPINISILRALTPSGSTAETETAETETKRMLKNFISRLRVFQIHFSIPSMVLASRLLLPFLLFMTQRATLLTESDFPIEEYAKNQSTGYRCAFIDPLVIYSVVDSRL
jgi:hypothetical protein